MENHDDDDDAEDDLNVGEVRILIGAAIQSHVCCFSLAHASGSSSSVMKVRMMTRTDPERVSLAYQCQTLSVNSRFGSRDPSGNSPLRQTKVF